MPSIAAEMHIAIVGNSHIGALKKAWDATGAPDTPFGRITFFGAMSASFAELAVDAEGMAAPEGSELRRRFERTSNGLHRIDYAAYDAVVLVGLGTPFRIFAAQLREHLPYDLAVHYPSATQPISCALLQGMFDELMTMRPQARIASAVGRMPAGCPLYTVAQPCPPEKLFGTGSFLDRSAFDGPFAMALYDRYAGLQQAHADSFGATFLPQDPETWVLPGITADRFNQDFVTISGTVRNRDDDFSHMNLAYGAAMLGHLARHIAARQRGTPTA